MNINGNFTTTLYIHVWLEFLKLKMPTISCHRLDFIVTSKYKLFMMLMAKEQWWTVYNLSSFSLCHSDKSSLCKTYYLWHPCWDPIYEILIAKKDLILTAQYFRGSFKTQGKSVTRNKKKSKKLKSISLYSHKIYSRKRIFFFKKSCCCYFIDYSAWKWEKL